MQKALFATRLVGNEMILVPMRNNVSDMSDMFTLNEVASFIWEQIDEHNSEADIATAVANEFAIDEETARNDVDTFILKVEKLINSVSN